MCRIILTESERNREMSQEEAHNRRCRKLYSQRMAAETPEAREERLAIRRVKDQAHRDAETPEAREVKKYSDARFLSFTVDTTWAVQDDVGEVVSTHIDDFPESQSQPLITGEIISVIYMKSTKYVLFVIVK